MVVVVTGAGVGVGVGVGACLLMVLSREGGGVGDVLMGLCVVFSVWAVSEDRETVEEEEEE